MYNFSNILVEYVLTKLSPYGIVVKIDIFLIFVTA